MNKNVFTVLAVCLFASVTVAFSQDSKPILKFGLIADSQYADADPGGSRFYRNSLEKLEESVGYFNSQGVQFTVNLGDIIDRDQKDLDTVLAYLNRSDRKVWSITGNHDYKGVTENKVLYKKLNMPSEYYSFKKRNWVFVFLNTNEVAAYSNVAGTGKEQELKAMRGQIKATGGKQGASWNGGISARQMKWLDKLLAKSERAGERVLVFSHHPLYPQTAFTALNNMEILGVIGRYSCVKAIFSGHHHAGGFAFFKNIPAVTVEGMIETEDTNSYGVVEIFDDKIVVEGKGRMTSREFKL